MKEFKDLKNEFEKEVKKLNKVIPKKTELMFGFQIGKDFNFNHYLSNNFNLDNLYQFYDSNLDKSVYHILLRLDLNKISQSKRDEIIKINPRELSESTQETLPTKYMVRKTGYCKDGIFNLEDLKETVIEVSNKYKELNK